MVFKAARCPNCSGELMLDPSKRGGFCSHCGSEIVVEEAINAVRLDGIASLESLIQLAKEAAEDGDYENALAYYNRCYELDPNNSEVILGRAMTIDWDSKDFTKPEDVSKMFSVVNSIKRAVEKASEKEKLAITSQASKYLNDLALQIFDSSIAGYTNLQSTVTMAGSGHEELEMQLLLVVLFALYALDTASDLSPYSRLYISNTKNVAYAYIDRKSTSQWVTKHIDFYEALKSSEEIKAKVPSWSKTGFQIEKYEPKGVYWKYKVKLDNYVGNEREGEIKDQDARVFEQGKTINKSGISPCYVATAVYNDASAPQVVLLRKYRDQVLVRTFMGLLFVRLYYRISPPVAERLNNNRINSFIRNRLDDFVNYIKKRHAL